MENKNKIVFIILFMGEYQWYIPYFIKSCVYNPSIDFVVLTDNPRNFLNLPDNIKVSEYTLGQFKIEASRSLGFEVAIDKGYKLCDFRPAIGCIFPNLIKGYDFWGYCDVDLVLGNIRSFLTDELLNSYDVISARHDYLTGCFSLFRNTPYINYLYEHSKDYVMVFTNEKNYCFDEAGDAYSQFSNNVPIDQVRSEYESMTEVVKKLAFYKKLRAYFEFQIVEGTPGCLQWDRGTLIFKGEYEALLYHFIKFKEVYNEDPNNLKVVPDRYEITKDRINLVVKI